MRPFYLPGKSISPLTPREKEVMTLLSTGLLNKEIAKTLGLRVQTVCNILYNVYIKLNVNNRVEAVNQFKNLLPVTTENNLVSGIRA